METIYRINRLNYEIKEIPIIFKDRAQGKSKIPKIPKDELIPKDVMLYTLLFFQPGADVG